MDSVLVRCSSLGIPLEQHRKNNLIQLQKLNPAELSPGEFIAQIREEVEEHHCRVVIIDSLNGLLNAMQEEAMLVQLHELFTYLNHRGVSTFMIMAQFGIVGTADGISH